MKILFALVLTTILASMANGATTEDKKALMELLSINTGVERVELMADDVMWVKVDPAAVGEPLEEKAQSVADQMAEIGYLFLEEDFCVMLYHGDHQKLAGSCMQKKR